MKKKICKALAIVLFATMLFAMLPTDIVSSAVTFDDINQPSVFIKQQTNVTCTLAAAVMLVRRTAMMDGNANWSSITESSMRSTAWNEGSGLWFKFTYAGVSVGHKYTSLSSDSLRALLADHPEGIVIYNSSKPHAVLATDYTNGVIYCADSSSLAGSGRIPLSQCSLPGNGESGKISGIDAIWYVTSPSVSLEPSIIKLTLDPNGGTGGTREVYFKKGVNKFYSNSACTNEITKINPPTRDGYTFDQYYGDGSSGGENGERYIYSDGSFASDLCTDITKDATFYAKWTQKTYYLDVNLLVDGEEVVGNAGEYCTFDVYINGALVEDDAVDYYQKHPAGTTYEIRDIKAAGCNTYVGVHNGSLSGTIGNGDVDVYLSFVTSHNWGNWTNLSETQHQRVCANDPSHVDVSDHNWVMIVDEPTCISPAVRKFVCGECGAVYTVTDGEWSDWREGEGFGFDGAEVETKTQYRYSDRTTVSSEWKQSGTGTIDYAVSWPSGFDTSSSIYSKYNKSASGYENGTQKRVINSNSKIGYIYWHWCRNQTQSGGPKNRIVYPYKTGSYSTFHAFYSAEDYEYRTFSNNDPAYVSSQSSVCGDSFYWVDTRVTINRAAYTDYVKENEYSWSDYSEWQDTPVEGSEARVVETRKVFRFKYPAEYGDHKWDSGRITVAPTTTTPGIITYTCTLCGETRMEIVSALGERIKGDFDGDGQITVADALSALRIAAKLAEETPQSIEIGDIDGDGHVTVSDALSILRVAAKLADASSLV